MLPGPGLTEKLKITVWNQKQAWIKKDGLNMKSWIYKICIIFFLVYVIKNTRIERDSSGNIVNVMVDLLRVSDINKK